jgi:hypothetical protein
MQHNPKTKRHPPTLGKRNLSLRAKLNRMHQACVKHMLDAFELWTLNWISS